MTPDWFLAVTIFALVTCFTPGPNNTMLTASGLNFGFARSIAHVLGVSIGFAGMVLAVALGIGAIFVMFPGLYVALKVVSIIYLLWLAWRIASASPKMGLTEGARPLTLLEGAAFQWVNPKAWTMTLSASTTYVAAESPTQSIIVMSIVFLIAGLASSSTWAAGGTALRRLIGRPRLIRAINIVLALLLVGSLTPALRELLSAAFAP